MLLIVHVKNQFLDVFRFGLLYLLGAVAINYAIN